MPGVAQNILFRQQKPVGALPQPSKESMSRGIEFFVIDLGPAVGTRRRVGVLFRDPRKPAPPEVAQDSTLPWRSLRVMMVLLKDAWMWAIPSTTVRLTFFLTFVFGLAITLDRP